MANMIVQSAFLVLPKTYTVNDSWREQWQPTERQKKS